MRWWWCLSCSLVCVEHVWMIVSEVWELLWSRLLAVGALRMTCSPLHLRCHVTLSVSYDTETYKKIIFDFVTVLLSFAHSSDVYLLTRHPMHVLNANLHHQTLTMGSEGPSTVRERERCVCAFLLLYLCQSSMFSCSTCCPNMHTYV